MKTRFKTYGEFKKAITIVNAIGGGIKIICNLKNYVLLETQYKPWNTKDMKTTFLVRLYIKEVLWKCQLSKFIQRTEGYELLGRRVMVGEQVAVIVNKVDVVNSETGEPDINLTISIMHRNTPTHILASQIQL